MRQNKKTKIVQISILTTALFLNIGCSEYFNGSSPQKTVKRSVEAKTLSPRVLASPSSLQQPTEPNIVLTTIPVECTDDINSPNSCHKKPIKRQELHPKSVGTQGGEVHKLRSIQGQSITIEERSNGFIFPQYPNKVVILQMFGKNCSHCIKEMPIMRKLYQRYKGQLEILAVQVEEKMSSSEAKTLLQRHRIKYPVIPGENATNLQYNIQSTYGWRGVLPYTLVIKNGVTEFNYPGEVSFREINKDVTSLF